MISGPVYETILKVTGLSAYYNGLRALCDIHLEVRKGGILSIIGANSAGKSTLLKTIMGMMNRGHSAHFEGSIEYAGRNIDGLSVEEIVNMGITMVPEGRRLFSRMSVEDNLRAGAFLSRCRSNVDGMIDEIFELFPLIKARRNFVASQLSGGEQQMVAIGRALMSSPELILFDELSMGLAPIVVNGIYEKIEQINNAGITCIVIEQDLSRALGVSGYACIMLEGRIVLKGSPDQLSEQQVTAAYFGSHTEELKS
jgi:branched-chain amino acid transport system ATP-binding protein